MDGSGHPIDHGSQCITHKAKPGVNLSTQPQSGQAGNVWPPAPHPSQARTVTIQSSSPISDHFPVQSVDPRNLTINFVDPEVLTQEGERGRRAWGMVASPRPHLRFLFVVRVGYCGFLRAGFRCSGCGCATGVVWKFGRLGFFATSSCVGFSGNVIGLSESLQDSKGRI